MKENDVVYPENEQEEIANVRRLIVAARIYTEEQLLQGKEHLFFQRLGFGIAVDKYDVVIEKKQR